MAKRAQLDEVRPILNEVNEAVSTAETVIDKVEDVVDVVPEVLDKTVHVTAESARKGVRAMQSPRNLIIAFSLTGAVAGAALGVIAYRLQKKQIEKKLRAEFEAKLEGEIEAMQKFYEKRATKKQPFTSPEEAAEALLPKTREEKLAEEAADALNEYEGSEPPPGIISEENDPREGTNHRTRYDQIKKRRDEHGRFVPVKKGPGVPVSETRSDTEAILEAVQETEEVAKNVFVQQATLDDWDQEREEASRRSDRPYVISHDEFMESPHEDQRSITYYAGDDILADEREQHLEDVEGLVGLENLQLFGHGSRDSSIVHIRNERIEVDFEVVRRPGTYAEEVLGLEHSDSNPRIRKGRRGDGG